MQLRQKGQSGAATKRLLGLGLLWQQRDKVQCAHIWCPQSLTSIVHSWSKQMPQSSPFSSPSDDKSSSQCNGEGREKEVPLRMSLSLSILALMRALSRRVFASGLSVLMNLSEEGQTRGSAEEGFRRAAHAACFLFKATVYGILLQIQPTINSLSREVEQNRVEFPIYPDESRERRSAPQARSWRTHSIEPPRAAKWSGVLPG